MLDGKLNKRVSNDGFETPCKVAMNSFELDDLKELNEFDRHIEHSLLLDEKLYIRAKNKPLRLRANRQRCSCLRSGGKFLFAGRKHAAFKFCKGS